MPEVINIPPHTSTGITAAICVDSYTIIITILRICALVQFLPSFGFSNEWSWTKTFTSNYSAGMILGNIGRRVEEQNQEGKTGIKVYPSSLISQESFADHHGTVIQVGPSERRATCATAAFSGGILGANQALFPRNGQPFK